MSQEGSQSSATSSCLSFFVDLLFANEAFASSGGYDADDEASEDTAPGVGEEDEVTSAYNPVDDDGGKEEVLVAVEEVADTSDNNGGSEELADGDALSWNGAGGEVAGNLKRHRVSVEDEEEKRARLEL